MPARSIYAFAATIPAGTPASAPVTVDMPFPDATVSEVDITVPPGPSGLVGWQLWVLGGQALPTNDGGWVIADGRLITWQVENQPDSGAWQLVGYNTDIYDHTIYVEFQVAPVDTTAPAAALATADSSTATAMAIGGG